MKRTRILALLCLLTVRAWAQDTIKTQVPEFLKVDYSEIEQEIKDKDGAYYYPILLARYEACDSTLTNLEYSKLYYGFIFQPSFKPVSSEARTVGELLRAKKIDKAIKKSLRLLKNDPFNFDLIYYAGVALLKKDENSEMGKKMINRYFSLLDVIAQTGDGTSVQTAIKVIRVSDEYRMINSYFLIRVIKSQALVGGGCDKFVVEPSAKYCSHTIYFDISPSLAYSFQ